MRSKVSAGALAGLAAGLLYATIMHVTTAPMAMGDRRRLIMMVADVVRSDSLTVGWVVLLATGVILGGLFGATLGARASGVGSGMGWGALYGIFWWVVGTLVLMPVLLGMPAFAPLTMAPMRFGAAVGLAAYLLSGLLLGGLFAAFHQRQPSR